ncbi:MAG: DoxX family protein [Euryarchaeota archaeon]|nr:DoxX family protein [Euryarchaeota archaeon]
MVEATTRPPHRSEAHNKGAWTASILLAIVFFVTGGMKLMDMTMMREMFTQVWGYPLWFMFFIGIVEVTGAILVLIPKVAAYGGALLTINMIGAVGTHIMAGQWLYMLLPIIVGAIAVYLTWARLPETAGLETRARPVRQ